MNLVEHSLRMDVLRLSRENRILRRRCKVSPTGFIPDDAAERAYFGARSDVSLLMAESRELDAVNAPLFTETERNASVNSEAAKTVQDVNNVNVADASVNSEDVTSDRKAYMRAYMAKKRAEKKSGASTLVDGPSG
jgi:hypothetical protein